MLSNFRDATVNSSVARSSITISSTRETFLLETGRILTRHHCPLTNRLAEARVSLHVRRNVFAATRSLGKPAEKVS